MDLPKLVPVEEARRMFGKKGTIQQFDRITRAFRQIVVLEFELRGLFNGPDRDAIRPLRLARPPKDPFKVEDLHKLLADLHGKQTLSSLKTRTDYRTGPIEDVVAGIRKTLGAEPPVDDPFAPPPVPRNAARPAPQNAARDNVVPHKPPATVKLPEKPAKSESRTAPTQKALAFKAAKRAIQATGGKGFRIPSKKARKARANRPHGRAPPR
jgi:hypothetical protein